MCAVIFVFFFFLPILFNSLWWWLRNCGKSQKQGDEQWDLAFLCSFTCVECQKVSLFYTIKERVKCFCVTLASRNESGKRGILGRLTSLSLLLVFLFLFKTNGFGCSKSKEIIENTSRD